MFKDHLIYSNNLQDAFYQARVYQQQMLNEEKKKTDLKVLTQIVEELNKTIHLIENNQIQLDEERRRGILGVVYDALDFVTGNTAKLKKLLENWQKLHPSQWEQLRHLLHEKGILYVPTRWNHPARGLSEYIIKEVRTDGGVPVWTVYRWNGERWVLVVNGKTPWGRSNFDGQVDAPRVKGANPNSGRPGENGGWGENQATLASSLDDEGMGPAGGFGNNNNTDDLGNNPDNEIYA
jgi:hypothetical protein